ncbi:MULTISPECIES: DUF3592 domain-containing protein [Micromonospora]|uniref:DUF3592 domain-containing protein n=1 Tax=Micromonospora TaxID=1873 RepID=UPI0003EEDCD1|nr:MULTISPECIES: DUF3592 domain-containing protein [Micromonospora]EWM66104.1 hypothetical protein MCBG_03237 [Micromonospora sp. M42]MBP1780801.1 hypothetical protein [Micromonospora sp. HB375]MBQ1061009.1 DUF3592 domain-containing protein [Micromonospora sp. C41]MCK1807820.1 DUF3592 domain-containing protein [Micromonospora sp. R42106]MCK1832473.1 DUF3592 domain-containing protein [Micromonospora sp. R42003]
MDESWEQLHPRQRKLIGALIILTASSAFMCCAAFYNGTTAIGLANRGLTTDATVVDVDRHGRASKVTVEFTPRSGEPLSAECTSCSPELDEGDRVRIRYNPDDLAPGVEDAENHGAQRVAVFNLVAATALLSGAGFAGWRLHRDRPV